MYNANRYNSAASFTSPTFLFLFAGADFFIFFVKGLATCSTVFSLRNFSIRLNATLAASCPCSAAFLSHLSDSSLFLVHPIPSRNDSPDSYCAPA